MARSATIIDHVADVWGDLWDVREDRETRYGFAVRIGWPDNIRRGRSASGGPRVIVTAPLAAYLTGCARSQVPIVLPIGATSIKRLRRLLGLHREIDRAQWWADRSDDLADLTIEQFCARHAVSAGAVSNARQAMFGRTLRPAGWWRAPDVASILLSPAPAAAIADELGISAGAVRRLRSVLRR